jgi:hypothetical protein
MWIRVQSLRLVPAYSNRMAVLGQISTASGLRKPRQRNVQKYQTVKNVSKIMVGATLLLALTAAFAQPGHPLFTEKLVAVGG